MKWYMFDLRLACNTSTEKDLLVFSADSWDEIAEFYDNYIEKEGKEAIEYIVITNYLHSKFD